MEIFKNASGYAPLLVNLAGYWERSFAELPDELKHIVENAFSTFPWDTLNTAGRKNIAAQLDYQHDPRHEPAVYFALVGFANELPHWIEKAANDGKDAAVVALRNVEDQVKAILDTDRARVGAEIQALRAMKEQAEKISSSRDHVSEKLAFLNQAAQQFWVNVKRDDRGTHPNNTIVVAWLEKNKFSGTLAKKAATIIRPEWAQSGRKPGK